MTYNYQDGSIDRDFRLKKEEDICKVMYHTPTKVGGNICSKCKYNQGYFENCIMCNHPKQNDSEDISNALNRLYDNLKHKALCALDY